jgi:hypothetical protein
VSHPCRLADFYILGNSYIFIILEKDKQMTKRSVGQALSMRPNPRKSRAEASAEADGMDGLGKACCVIRFDKHAT